MASQTPATRRAQLRAMVQLARAHNPNYLPRVIGLTAAAFVFVLVVGILVGHWILLGLLPAVLAAAIVFMLVSGKAANEGAFSQLEGQPGAAYAVLQSMRGDWRVTPAVGVTRSQEIVHRVVGRAGVVLVAEGSPSRARDLLNAELRKTRRVIGDTPLYDVVVGDGEGQVPLRRLSLHIGKLPRNLKPRDVDAVDTRLKAIGSVAPPIPKGPLPKGGKVPRGKMR